MQKIRSALPTALLPPAHSLTVPWLVSLALAASLPAAGLELSGRVLDPSGRPIEGARAVLAAFLEIEERSERILAGELTYDPLDEDVTDEAGRYRLEAPGPGHYGVLVEAPGHRPLLNMVTPLLGPTVLADAEPKPAKRLRVEVRDAAGKAVAGARLMLFARPQQRGAGHAGGWRLHSSRALCDEHGAATLAGGEGEKWWLSVIADGFAAETSEVRGSAESVRLERGAARRLRFVDGRGRAAPAMVMRRREPLGRAGEDGFFELRMPTNLPGRGLELRAYAGLLEAGFVEVGAGPAPDAAPDADAASRATEIELRALPEWTGTVHDRRTGEPIAGALVWSHRRVSRAALTDGAGNFTITVEPRYRISSELLAAAAGYGLGSIGHDVGRGLHFTLEPRDELTGRVVDPEQQPVEGARVLVGSWSAFGDSSPDETVTGGDGRFAVAVPLDSPFTVTGSAAGFGSRRLEVAAGERSPILIELGPRRVAFGQVVSPAGEPIAGAEVTLQPADASGAFWAHRPFEPLTATSTAGGRFVLEDIAAGDFRLGIEAADWPPLERHHVEVPEQSLEIDLGRFQMEPGVAIEGRVWGDGEPLADVGVRAISHRQVSVHAARTETGADGRFVLEGVPEGRVQLHLSKAGWFARPAPVGKPGDPVSIEMHRQGVIEGRILDRQGAPIARATVQIEGSGFSTGTSSDEDGSFRQEALPGRYTLRVYADGFRPHDRGDLVLELGEKKPLEIVLEPGLSLEGTVFDPDGSPLGEAHVYVSAISHRLAPERTGPDGRFALAGLGVGSTQVQVSHERWGHLTRELDVESSLVDLELRFPAGVALAGQVTEAGSGEPVAGATMMLSPQSADGTARQLRSRADGSFRFEHLADGRYVLSVQHADHAPVVVEPVELAGFDIADLGVELAAGSELRGRVLGLAPEEILQVQMLLGADIRVVRVDGDGSFRFDKLGPGSWWLTAQADGGREARRRVTIERGAGPLEVELTFEDDGFHITGELGRRGQPMPGVTVHINAAGFSGGRYAHTDHQGRFELRSLRAGVYQVVARREGQTLFRREIEVTGDDHWSFEVRGGRVEGRVVDESGAGVEGAQIRLRDKRSQFAVLFARSDGRGAFFIDHAPPSSYELSVHKKGRVMAPRPIELDESGATDLVLVLERAAGVLLRPLRADGSRPAMVIVARLDAGGRPVQRTRLHVDESGVAHYRSLPSGSWTLLVAEPDGAAVEWPVTVSEAAPSDAGSPVLPPGGRLVVHAAGLTDGGMGLRLHAKGAGGRPYRSPYDGWLFGEKIERALPAGAWQLVVEAADGRTWRRQVEIRAGVESELHLP